MVRDSGGTLFGATAIVTGASSGIGREVARRLAGDGAAVVINYYAQEDAARELAGAITAGGGRAITVAADVSDEDDVTRLFAETVGTFGRVDILIANAGTQKDAPFVDMTLADWHRVIDLDLTGVFLCCRAAVRQFRVQEKAGRPFRSAGSIVTMTSVHDRIPWAGHANYAAAKSGASMLMRTVAQEVAEFGIRVNAFAPGAIRTAINRPVWGSAEGLSALLETVPYGRIGEPADVAAAVAWLVSDEADYVTGSTVYVDGGMTMYPDFRRNG
ncbi:glucose 1-dehydrogenase [Micromonospora sp. WMMD980]|uniref:glucose 1-dehydrogenase n=1 Tax=Micromonospora sp. WMMD980 TaxID=3016088 RepID=UPI002416F0FA|nr:glucose 1-dehydrogenase [Micromonospora sp. WMMD980]MDG4799953.1 SDR family oxidoreductase [Micromonospora sp. WMMD980]